MQKHEHKGKSSSEYIDADSLIAKLPLSDGMNIVDAGCGDGYFSFALGRHFPNSIIYAVDNNEQSINSCMHAVSAKPVLADIKTDLPGPSDAIIMINILHGLVYNDEIDDTMLAISKSLRASGYLIIVDFYKRENAPGPSMDIKLSVDQTTAVLYQNGFKTVNIFPAGNYHYAVVSTRR